MEKVKPIGILKINFVENVGGFGVKNLKENKGQRVVKSFKKINASKIPPNQWKRLSYKQRLSQLSWILKKLVVWGWNNNEKGQTGGKIYMRINVPRIPPNQ